TDKERCFHDNPFYLNKMGLLSKSTEFSVHFLTALPKLNVLQFFLCPFISCISCVQRCSRFEENYFDFFWSIGSMFYTVWYHYKLAFIDPNIFIPELHYKY